MVDIIMGNLVGLGMIIGVFSGVGNWEFLEKEVDVVFNNIDEFFDILYLKDF